MADEKQKGAVWAIYQGVGPPPTSVMRLLKTIIEGQYGRESPHVSTTKMFQRRQSSRIIKLAHAKRIVSVEKTGGQYRGEGFVVHTSRLEKLLSWFRRNPAGMGISNYLRLAAL